MGHSATDFRFARGPPADGPRLPALTASTDLNAFNVDGPVFSYLENLTKLLALGFDGARGGRGGHHQRGLAIGRSAELGSLAPGRPAEFSVIEVGDDRPVPVSDGLETLVAPAAIVARWAACGPGPGCRPGTPASFATSGPGRGGGCRSRRVVDEPPTSDDLWLAFDCFWHPVGTVAELQAAGGVMAARLLGRDLVVARLDGGTVAAMIDRCLHRSTRLSVGCVDRGAVRCAYHGWRWDATGAA